MAVAVLGGGGGGGGGGGDVGVSGCRMLRRANGGSDSCRGGGGDSCRMGLGLDMGLGVDVVVVVGMDVGVRQGYCCGRDWRHFLRTAGPANRHRQQLFHCRRDDVLRRQ